MGAQEQRELSDTEFLIERVVRVEEELRHQRELIYQNQELIKMFMQQVDKRFEMMQWMIGLGWVSLVGLMTLYKYLA